MKNLVQDAKKFHIELWNNKQVHDYALKKHNELFNDTGVTNDEENFGALANLTDKSFKSPINKCHMLNQHITNTAESPTYKSNFNTKNELYTFENLVDNTTHCLKTGNNKKIQDSLLNLNKGLTNKNISNVDFRTKESIYNSISNIGKSYIQQVNKPTLNHITASSVKSGALAYFVGNHSYSGYIANSEKKIINQINHQNDKGLLNQIKDKQHTINIISDVLNHNKKGLLNETKSDKFAAPSQIHHDLKNNKSWTDISRDANRLVLTPDYGSIYKKWTNHMKSVKHNYFNNMATKQLKYLKKQFSTINTSNLSHQSNNSFSKQVGKNKPKISTKNINKVNHQSHNRKLAIKHNQGLHR